MNELLTPENLLSLLTLTLLEVVLGIDNVIFISILADKLPRKLQDRARYVGLVLAMVMRIGLLMTIKWIMGLHQELFRIGDLGFTGRELILLGGGAFLTWKTVKEIWAKIREIETHKRAIKSRESFSAIVVQIVLIDIVFSFDSILTAVGLVDVIEIMIAAVVISVAIMMLFAGGIARYVNSRPTVKMLALAFLVVIGLLLIAEGLGQHVDKGYIYFAMAFSFVVDMLNRALLKKYGVVPGQTHGAEPSTVEETSEEDKSGDS